ncbi:MAG: hypothetical protein WEB37_08860 [Bacteroidota bacterium]
MHTLKSVGAVLAGFVTVVVLSVVTDFILDSAGIFPPQTDPAAYTGFMLFWALVYRCMYTVAGGYVTAWLAPDRPMRYAVILGIVGTVAGTAGVIFSWELTPHHWYPILLAVTALPCTWLGGWMRVKRNVQLRGSEII